MDLNSVYMGIDAGTTKLKLMLYGADMKEIGSSSRDTHIYIPENGASEIDMDELWAALCDASQELAQRYPEAMARLKGLGISGQGDGLWPLDADGGPPAARFCGTIPAARCWTLTPRPGWPICSAGSA